MRPKTKKVIRSFLLTWLLWFVPSLILLVVIGTIYGPTNLWLLATILVSFVGACAGIHTWIGCVHGDFDSSR